MNLLMVVGEYPKTSEQFIYRDMAWLQKRGVSLYLYPLKKHQLPVASDQFRFPELARAWSLADHALLAVKQPRQYVRAFLSIFKPNPWNLHEILIRCKQFLFLPGVARQCAKLKIAQVHAHFAYLPTDVAKMLALLNGLPFSVSVHAWDIHCQTRWLVSRLAGAEMVVCCSHAGEKIIRRVPFTRQPPKNIITIHHGLDLQEYAWQPERYGSGPFRLIAAGRFVPKKGFAVLLQACALLCKQKVAYTLTLCGDGPLRTQLMLQAKTLGLEPQVRFVGWLSAQEMRKEMSSAQACVIPSVIAADQDQEGIPNVLIEALALGTPCIASAGAAIPEVIKHGETGYLTLPGDAVRLAQAIRECQADSRLRAQISVQGRKWIENEFDGEKNSAKWIQWLEPARERVSGE